MRPSRREFVKWVTASGIALSLSRLASAEEPDIRGARDAAGTTGLESGRHRRRPHRRRRQGHRRQALRLRFSRRRSARAGRRRPSHAMLVRAPDATHVYTGIDLARLSGALKPSVVVTAADLARIGTRVPEFYAGDLFCPVGKTPLYLGQPVALLIFEKFDAFDQARLALRDGDFVKFGEETGPVVMPDYGAYRFTRVAGPTPDAPDVYSPVQAGWVSPGTFPEHRAPDMDAARDRRPGAPTPRPRPMASRSAPSLPRTIRRCWCSTANSRRNPSTRCFSSRKAGSPGTTRARKNLELVLGVQSPYEAAEALAYHARQRAGSVQAGAHQAHVRLYGRRIRRTRPYALPALCRAGGDVPARPSGAARA